MQDELCEIRVDIPLKREDGPRQFERSWRTVLAAQKLSVLAMPGAEAVSARFCVCGCPGEEFAPTLDSYLPARLAALPGSPAVSFGQSTLSADWRGVKVWLTYRAAAMHDLLRQAKTVKPFRGNRR